MRISDWSSDVCSSDLIAHRATRHLPALQALAKGRSDFVSPRMKARLMATSDTVSFGYEQVPAGAKTAMVRSEEHTSELQSLMRISYAVFCLKTKTKKQNNRQKQRATTSTCSST